MNSAENPTVSENKARETVRVLAAQIRCGARVLAIVPDATRSAPLGQVFRLAHEELSPRVAKLDVMIALGTHAPMSPEAINARFEMTQSERETRYKNVEFFNHAWNDETQLHTLGVLTKEETRALSDGLLEEEVAVEINARVLAYDVLLILGPVFPHEVAGFSGGNKYLFPGIGGPRILDFFHWLGALVTNPKIIGIMDTPVRDVIDAAAKLVPIPRLALCMVVAPQREPGEAPQLAGLFAGTPESAWREAANLSEKLHIVYKAKPFHTVLSCAPEMYDDLWTGGKCMYKLEPVVADGGELIIYAPHIREISVTHGQLIEKIGYHTRDYFLKQSEKFEGVPRAVIAHSTHVRGIGEYSREGGEKPRIRVTLATGIPEEICRRINMGYLKLNANAIQSYENREKEGILLVRKAGEMLYRLKEQPR
jgi:nickel-dependent lactate racemase